MENRLQEENNGVKYKSRIIKYVMNVLLYTI